LRSPASAGIDVGLAHFPLDELELCNAVAAATPVVPIAALPGVATPILDWINMTMANGGTPTLPALEGAIAYARQREMMTGRRTAIALATDGEPNLCESTVDAVSAVAAAGAASGLFTFVIGVGPSLQNLNAIAVAGGTKMAYQVEMATADQLAAAFKTVQLQASKLACSFMIPAPPMGMTLDPDRVNVRFTPVADPGMPIDLGRVDDRTTCGAQGGWYFDDPMNPTSVTLCEASCAKLNASGEGSLSLLFGCRGIVIK